jgi:pimeloyl-[acyl-carrier protein] methyl ester esterase
MTLYTHSSGKGRDLLLIHGWGMNSAVWLPWVQQLAKEYRVTLAELPGHGESPWSGSLNSLDDWAGQMLRVAPPGAIWIGWSLGGLVMQQAALGQGDKISAILGMASSPCFVQRPGWHCAIASEVLRDFGAELQADSRKTLRRFLSLQVQGAADARRILRQLQQEFTKRPAPHSGALQTGLELLLNVDLRPRLAGLDLPVSWILGDRDALVPKCLAQELPDYHAEMAVQLIPGAAHAPFLSHPQQCSRLLEEFVRHV